MTGRRGFSLVEALVALIVAALALLAVFELQQQLVRSQRRHEQALARAGMERNALVLVEDLNPSAEPAGERRMAGGRSLRWRSTMIGRPQPNRDYPVGAGRFEVTLYRVDVEVLDQRRRRLGRFSVRKLGWRPLDGASP